MLAHASSVPHAALRLVLLVDGGIHLWAAALHAPESPSIAAALALAGVLQIGLAAYLVRNCGGLAFATVAVLSAALVAAYAVAVTSGLPSLDSHDRHGAAHDHGGTSHAHHASAASEPSSALHREEIGLLGGASKGMELAAVALAVGLAGGRAASPRRRPASLARGLTLVGLGALALAACGAPAPPSATVIPAQAAPLPMRAEIRQFAFKPEALRVPVGTTVAWTNQDDIEHSVTHGSPEQPGGRFDSGLFTSGGKFDHPFTAAGEYPYFCTRHPHMRAVVQVVGG